MSAWGWGVLLVAVLAAVLLVEPWHWQMAGWAIVGVVMLGVVLLAFAFAWLLSIFAPKSESPESYFRRSMGTDNSEGPR